MSDWDMVNEDDVAYWEPVDDYKEYENNEAWADMRDEFGDDE
jgi:hypothetical protein